MKSETKIKLRPRDVEALLLDLEQLVVSFDRLGSEFHEDPERLAIETDKFLSDINAFKKLARMRQVLIEAYDAQSTTNDISNLEKRLGKARIWPNHTRRRSKV